MKRKTIIQIVSVVIIISIVTIVLKACQSTKSEIKFETTLVSKGSISNTVTATGTIQAIKTVAVGTQVSGVIKKIYVDFNSVVKKGQILARIDETPLLATLDQSKSAVISAEADLQFKKATYDRTKALFEKKLIAKADYDQAVLNYDQSKANLSSAKSNYDRNKINLEYATIYSPIDGVVLNRAVDEGQTVAASFNTPTLFSIANDLTQMRVEANIDEADIGQVKLGQRVEFNVDAYQDIKFTGTVTQVRLQPVVTSNVVTYTVIIEAPNPDKKLMPGMTANASIYVDEAKDLLIVDSKALRFMPDSKLMGEYMKKFPQAAKTKINQELSSKTKGAKGVNNQSSTLWLKKGNEIEPVKVVTGLSDGTKMEIKSGVSDGDEVIFAMQSSTTNSDTAKKETVSSPFMPKRPGGGPKK
ncbi:MAG: efflux RND transporter periplasmic adaptor subunit [Bacteroidetes bacterium]|nr:efflux RND transporter periplasmic adaptor subunit [Bacteroidota bacterium]